MKVLAIFPKCDAASRFSSPYNGMIQAFEDLGVSLYVLAGSDLVGRNLTELRSAATEDRIIALVAELNPDMVVSVNNHGMTRRVRAGIRAPVVKWLFDDLEHFYVDQSFGSWPDTFDPEDVVVCYSSELCDRILSACPSLRVGPIFLPHAASIQLFRDESAAPRHNISFIGSYLDVGPALYFLQLFGHADGGIALAVEEIVKTIRSNPQADVTAEVAQYGLADRIRSLDMRPEDFKRILSDVITTRDRLAAVTSLKELGIAVYGKNDWVLPLIFFEGAERIFQHDARLDTQVDLVRAYQNSLITIDVPNIQNRTAIGGRVIEAMASGSLLITKFQKGSDLYKVFGPDCPVPTYRDLPELFSLCAYYLTNPEAMQEVIVECNQLVSSGFDYKDRINFVLGLGGMRATEDGARVSAALIRDL